MREKIIKLLLSKSDEDREIGREYFQRFYHDEIWRDKEGELVVILTGDLNRILKTAEFTIRSKVYVFFRGSMAEWTST